MYQCETKDGRKYIQFMVLTAGWRAGKMRHTRVFCSANGQCMDYLVRHAEPGDLLCLAGHLSTSLPPAKLTVRAMVDTATILKHDKKAKLHKADGTGMSDEDMEKQLEDLEQYRFDYEGGEGE